MKSKVNVDVIVHDEQWLEAVDFDVFKVVEELKELAFGYIEEVYSKGQHEFLSAGYELNVNVCLSNDDEVHQLNKEFRGIDKPTNVLSFANIDGDFFEEIERENEADLGEIVLAFETLQQEAYLKNITVYAHFCHLLVHGFLHLLGFDHQKNSDATVMEGLEVEILDAFSIDNPYSGEEV